MNSTFKAVLASALLFLTQFVHGSNLSVELFASLPDVSNVKLSPNGKKVASLIRVNSKDKNGTAINLLDIESGKKSYPVFVENIKYTITDIHWKGNENLLISTRFADMRTGTPTIETRLLNLDLNTGKTQSVVPPSFFKRMGYVPQIQTRVIDYLPKDPNHLLLSLRGFENSSEPAVVKVSLSRDGKTAIIKGAEKNIIDWMTDQQHRIRISVELEDTTYRINLHDANDPHRWKKLWEFEAFSDDMVWPLGFSQDARFLFVKALYKGKDAIFKTDISQPKLIKTLVHSDPNYDITGALRRSEKTGEVIGVGSFYWDKKYKNLQTMLDNALPDTENLITGFSEDESKYIALATSTTEPGIYILGDQKKKSIEAIAYRYEKLTPEILNQVQTISYQARDGLTIEGFLTLPKHIKGKSFPTVVFPHGGPISFDSDGFDYWTQFLSSRGYAVLQMNFRGSSGYGHDFMAMGLQNWGKAMQDDVEDGAKWLIKKGIADPDKVCIVGASYGGYAALMGVIKNQELYRCAISFAGISNLRSLVKSSRFYTNYEITKSQLGSDYDELWDTSPLKHVDKIKVPILLIHGEKDRVVRKKQSEDLYDELIDANKEVTYIELENGDHYLSNSKNRLEAFSAIESFLAKHLNNAN
ncbi:S9 family peptidase [Aliikangiella marina]|uniref:S9 family peptidase n=1 Tax=Aliikangiella marina TaxID=1712262 RepID=A0A545T9A5_9GAMM|nr:S9 family peptidase [Aliikangiella marina]TQV73800.1 S9 family peptidase [Aliikangiella marina]